MTGIWVQFRPILMTSSAMILGMLPVAFAFGSTWAVRVSMGVTVIGGIISSTLLTLVVTPVVYTFLDCLSTRFRRKVYVGAERADEFRREE